MNVPDKNIAGPRIQAARRELGLTQDQLSAKLARAGIQIDRAGIAKIENGLRRVYDYELRAFAEVLAVSVDELVGGR
ncbi:MAG: helix-turn-helix transcriptional regulator [Verrucomicrobia bacterium]|nr:helix-turn-helix transcriptional regulator [Verrucomicrobiota bacterium]